VRIPSHTLLGSNGSEAQKKRDSNHSASSRGEAAKWQASRSVDPSVCSEGIWGVAVEEHQTPNLKRDTSSFEV